MLTKFIRLLSVVIYIGYNSSFDDNSLTQLTVIILSKHKLEFKLSKLTSPTFQ